MKIVVGSDHAGCDHKTAVIELISSLGHTAVDIGTNSKKSVDYPDYGEKGALIVASGEADMAILICGTGIGMSITANKIKGIRAALCWNVETATLARQHNNANVLCIGARFIPIEKCVKIAKVFVQTPNSTEERHIRRIKKISFIEERNQAREYNAKKT